jgi:hypothetical protein
MMVSQINLAVQIFLHYDIWGGKPPRKIENKIHSPSLIHRYIHVKQNENITILAILTILFTFRATGPNNMTVSQWNVMMYFTYFCICLKYSISENTRGRT